MDLITFEVMRNAFVAACYEASTTIERVAYHPVRRHGTRPVQRDFNTGWQAASRMVILMRPSITRRSVLQVVELLKDRPMNSMHRGDTFSFSDPYRTGSHVNDTRLIRPIFFDDQVVAFACTVIHWADMGGPMPAFNPEADRLLCRGYSHSADLPLQTQRPR